MDAKRITRRKTNETSGNNSVIVSNENQWNRLDNATMENVLARLPIADFLPCQFVSKRWYSVINSHSFHVASNELFHHGPWFLMLDSNSPANAIFDMEVNDWRHAHLPIPMDVNQRPTTPVAASGSLMCFRSEIGNLIVCNPLNGSMHNIPSLETNYHTKAIAMVAQKSFYELFVVFSDKSSSFWMGVFSSRMNTWIKFPIKMETMGEEEEMQPMPGNDVLKWSGVTIICSNGQVKVCYLSPGGRLVFVDFHQGIALMLPHLYPEAKVEKPALDLVECGGRIFIVSLIEKFEAVTIQLWGFDSQKNIWRHFSLPYNSNDYFGVCANINCAGCEDHVMVCVTSGIDPNFNRVVMYNISKDSWVELPRCSNVRGGGFKKFVATYSFKPDVKVNV